jgi:CheY-like chemotaxis protein
LHRKARRLSPGIALGTWRSPWVTATCCDRSGSASLIVWSLGREQSRLRQGGELDLQTDRGGESADMRTPTQTDATAAGSPAESSARDPGSSGSSELKDTRILLVEDTWHVGTAIRRLLRAWGADVAGPAPTVADAERLVAEGIPDVAIVDINLRNGERANDLIDRLDEQRIPVVVITGYTAASVPPGKVEAILQKPVSVEAFLAVLRPIIARKKNR